MAYSVDPSPAVGNHDDVHTSQLNALGAVRVFSDGNSYIYLKGVSSTAAGSWVVYDPGTWATALLATTSKGQCAVAMGAVDATTKFGWYGLIGNFSPLNLSATLSNNAVYASGTAGSGTSAITKNAQVKKAVTRGAAPSTTGGAAQATVIDRPFIGSYDESA